MSDASPQPSKGPLVTLFFLAFGFIVFQIVILRELRYSLNTLFTLTPFVFSVVIVLMGVGSFAARRVTLDAIAVGFLLICGAAGSFYSDRLERHCAFLVAVPLAVAAYALTAPFLNQATIGLPVGARVAAFAVHLLAPAFAAGAMFPASLRSFADQDVSGMFLIDLVGCALDPIGFWIALPLSGAWLVSALGVAAYALVSATILRRA